MDRDALLDVLKCPGFVGYAFRAPAIYRKYMSEWCGIGDFSEQDAVESINEVLERGIAKGLDKSLA